MSATDIELSQDHAVPAADVGHRRDHPVDDFVVEGGVGDLRSDMAMQSDQVQQRLAEHAFYGFRGMPTGQREAELLIRHPGGHGGMPVDVDIGGDAEQDLLRPACLARQVGDFHQRVHHHPTDADRRRVTQLVERFRVTVQHDSGRVEPAGEGGRQLAAGAHIDSEVLLCDPARDRRCQQRLRGIQDLGLGHGRPVLPHPMAEIRLVEDIGGVRNSSATSVNGTSPTQSRPRSSTLVVSGQIAGSIRGVAAW